VSHRTNTLKLDAVLLEIYLQGAPKTVLGRRGGIRGGCRYVIRGRTGKKMTAIRSTATNTTILKSSEKLGVLQV